MMADAAHRHGITVTGGIIEQEAAGSRLFNSMPVYSTGGRLATYRKVHLSRVLGVTSESDVLAEGDECVRFDLPADPADEVHVGMGDKKVQVLALEDHHASGHVAFEFPSETIHLRHQCRIK